MPLPLIFVIAYFEDKMLIRNILIDNEKCIAVHPLSFKLNFLFVVFAKDIILQVYTNKFSIYTCKGNLLIFFFLFPNSQVRI